MDKNKKRQQFDKICIDTWKEIYRFIYYKVQNKEEAQYVTQETYARAFVYWCKAETQIQLFLFTPLNRMLNSNHSNRRR